MASIGNNVFCYFCLVMLFFSSLIQARESKFFSKFTHYSTTAKNNFKETKLSLSPSPSLSPIEAPAPALILELAPAPAPSEIQGEIGYGLHGQRSDLFSSTPGKKSTTTGLGENELFDEEFYGESYEKEYQNRNYNNNYNEYKLASESHETANQHNYNGYTSNYNTNNGYELASGNYETSNQENKNSYYTSNYNNEGHETNQRQGMSDTRFMEDGKYHYSVKNDNYYNSANGYETGKVSTQNQGYYGNYKNQNQGYYGNSENLNQVYYGNSENQNEFNNREYDNQELYDEESQEESLP